MYSICSIVSAYVQYCTCTLYVPKDNILKHRLHVHVYGRILFESSLSRSVNFLEN